jgi:hypothetical protein
MTIYRQPREDNGALAVTQGIVRMLAGNWLAAVIILALVMGYLYLHTTPSDLSSVEEFEAVTQGGRPVLLEFYSNF